MCNTYYEYIDCICSSKGNFRDSPLSESTVSISQSKLMEFINVYKHTSESVNYSDVIESCLIMEKRLADRYHSYNLFSVLGMKDFVSHIISLFSDEYKMIFSVKSQWLEKFFVINPTSQVLNFIDLCGVSLSNISIQKRMALTRLLEDDNWMQNAYRQYRELNFSDFAKCPISIIPFSRDFEFSLEILEKKNTIWEDKVGGSIFFYPCKTGSTVPYLRTLFRTIHYILELHVHSLFVQRISDSVNFGHQFYGYLSEKNFLRDFFDVHALFESYIWKGTVKIFENSFQDIIPPHYKIDLLAWEDDGKDIIHSSNVIDIVSNLSHGRQICKAFRVTSMFIKSALLDFIGINIKSEEDIVDILISGKIAKK